MANLTANHWAWPSLRQDDCKWNWIFFSPSMWSSAAVAVHTCRASTKQLQQINFSLPKTENNLGIIGKKRTLFTYRIGRYEQYLNCGKNERWHGACEMTYLFLLKCRTDFNWLFGSHSLNPALDWHRTKLHCYLPTNKIVLSVQSIDGGKLMKPGKNSFFHETMMMDLTEKKNSFLVPSIFDHRMNALRERFYW